MKEKEEETKAIEQGYQDKLNKFAKDLETMYKENQKKEDLLKKVAEENESYRRYIENIKRENTNYK